MTLQNYGKDTAQSGGRGSPNAISPASDGQNWTQTAGATTPSIITANGRNRIKLTGDTAINVWTLGSRQFGDVDQYVRVLVSDPSLKVGFVARCTSGTKYYDLDLSNGLFELALNKNGTVSQLASATNAPVSSGTYYWIHLRMRGFGFAGSNPNNLQANYWADPNNGTGGTPTGEPSGWMLQASDPTLTSPGNFGFFYQAASNSHYAYFDAYTCTDCPAPDTEPAYNVTQVRPYGDTYYVASSPPPFPLQLVQDMVGPNSASNTGWGNGSNVRYQLGWNVVESVQGFYDWALLDHAVQLCNFYGVRLFYSFANPPTWQMTLDAMGSNATLAGTYSTGHSYTSIAISALPAGAFLPHGYQITIDWGGANAENLYIWNPGNTYQAGATSIGISTSQSSQVAWSPARSHSAGEPVREKTQATGQFASPSAMAAFASAVASRYNGLAGFGKIDVFQVENENYDIQNRVQSQGAYNTSGGSPASWNKSSTWDNGGGIGAAAYVAVRSAVKAISGHGATLVFMCAVRKTPTTGRAHIKNWMTGFVTSVIAAGGTIDGVDFHYYRNGSTDWDGTLVQDPTKSTYTDNTLSTINCPSVSVEAADLQAILAANNSTAQIMCGECGWDIYDDGGGANAATNATYTAGHSGGYSTLSVDNTTWMHGSQSGGVTIADATPIYVDYGNPTVTEVVYAWGQTASGAASIPITTNPAGSGAAQAAWTPASTHTSGITVYAQTSITPVTLTQQSTYTQAMYDALRAAGALYCFVFTINPPVSTVNSKHDPPSSQNTKGLTQTVSGTYTYEPAYDMTASYSASYPSWQSSSSGGQSAYVSAILADAPEVYYRLDETSGATALDSSGNHNNGTLSGSITHAQVGALNGDSDTATLFAVATTALIVPRTLGGTLVLTPTVAAGITLPFGINPASWSAATIEFWVKFAGAWNYVAVAYGSASYSYYLNGNLTTAATLQTLLGLASITIASLVGFINAVSSTCTLDEVAAYNTKLSATRIAAHYQAAGTSSQVGTALTVYGTDVASTTLPTAGQLATGTGGTDVAVTSKVGQATGYGELTALGTNAAWAGLSALPDLPTGNGWLLDSTLLANQQMLAGPWTVTLTLRVSNGNLTTDLYVRAWAYDTILQTYTPIGTAPLSGQQVTTTKATYSFSPASLGAYTFGSNQMLYLECWPNVTLNQTGVSSAQFTCRLSTTSSSGVVGDMQVGTPGFVAATSVTTGYTVYISGIPVFVKAGTLSLDNTIGRRSNAQFTVHATDTNTHYQQYQRVAIYDNAGNLAFSGYVNQPQEQKPGFAGSLNTQIQCIDQHFLADKRLVPNVTFTNRTVGTIVMWLLNNILAQEGVTYGQVYDGLLPSQSLYPSPTLYPNGSGVGPISSATFFYCTVAQALDELVKYASSGGISFYWMIDQYKKLWFVPYTAVTSTQTIDGTQIEQQNNNATVTRANPLYRNTQYIVGSPNQVNNLSKTITGDGHTTAWPMDYPLASAPTITDANGNSQSVALKGSQAGTAQYYWAAGDPIIAQDTSATPLAANATLNVTYNGQYQNVAKYSSTSLIDAQQALDGTSGIIEEAEQNATLTPSSAAISIAQSFVARYGVNGVQLQFQTKQAGFAPGQNVPVNLPMYGLSNTTMLLEEVSASDQNDSFNIWYTITAVQGPYDQSATYFWKRLLQSPAPSNTVNVGITSSQGG